MGDNNQTNHIAPDQYPFEELHCGQLDTSFILLSISIDQCSTGPSLNPVAPHKQAYQPISASTKGWRCAIKSTSSTPIRQRAFVMSRDTPILCSFAAYKPKHVQW